MNSTTSRTSRRRFVSGAAASLALLAARGAAGQNSLPAEGIPFSPQDVIEAAATLARSEYQPPAPMPAELSRIDQQTYRAIHFRKSEAIWSASTTRFSVELFAPGYIYTQGVDIHLVQDGMARRVAATPQTFETTNADVARLLETIGRFAGFRIHYPINSDDYADEFLVFRGASYFRGVSKHQRYGLSARGLAIDVAEPRGEEFPAFRSFWIERPQKGASHIVVHALLDSPGVTGAYLFTVRPGEPTTMDVEATLFPRRPLDHVGIGTLSSMFMHGPMDMNGRADWRPEVHDSLGLAMHTGWGERIWRPLSNPRVLQISGFVDESPKGFGLIQRERRFDAFQDLGARFDLRPSAWIRPLGDWGKGHVVLVEIPSESEANDNIIAYWRPAETMKPGNTYAIGWQISFDAAPPTAGIAPVIRSSQGLAFESSDRVVVIDYAPMQGVDPASVTLNVQCEPGRLVSATVETNDMTGGLRAAVRFDPANQPMSEIRVEPKRDDRPVGETFLYRWTAGG
ncbi:MAG: glucan biosynthesis protein G [Pseudomonadota bacterium]|nr:glucan biosynthesis protein G [Pseudomonadota bacterium]